MNEVNVNHGTFEHCGKLTAISLEETEFILSLIRREALTLLVAEFNRFRRLAESPSSHIFSCLFLDIKNVFPIMVNIKVEERSWDVESGKDFVDL